MPVDFLPITNAVVQDNQIYAIGSFMQSLDEQSSLFLEGAFVVNINADGPKVISFVKPQQKPLHP
jgi:hypothetical protein